MLKDKLPEILAFIESQRQRLKTEKKLYEIYEGGLLKHVDAALSAQLSQSAANEAKERIPPINILNKLVTKLSSLYVDKPERTPQNENDIDLVTGYELSMNLDSHLYDANIFFNLHRRVALEPYVNNKGEAKIRTIPGHKFLVYSDDRMDETNPTVFIKFAGQVGELDIIWLFTDFEFLAITSNGDIYEPDMEENPFGINPYGAIPFIYVNNSRYELLPEPDTELLRMTLLVPILYSDINFGAKYQVFSIIYGIDVDMNNLEINPNAFWSFKSDENGKKSEVGVIKPIIDMEAMTQSVTNQLATFFETRNLRGATISGFSAGRYGQQDNAASGVAILIQNLDTTEVRKAHAKIFREAEYKLWDLIANNLHPIWVEDSLIKETKSFSGDPVVTFFTPEYELKSDMALTQEMITKLDKGLVSKDLALKTLYPYMKAEQLNKLKAEIKKDEQVMLPPAEEDNGNRDPDPTASGQGSEPSNEGGSQ